MFRVFISYAQEQLSWATHLRAQLNAPGIQVFVAEHDLPIGDSLSADIVSEVKRCDLFVLLWTADARASEYVGKETFLAHAEGKPVIPVVFQAGVPLPDELGDIKYLDVTEDIQGQLAWLENGISRRAQSKATSNFIALGLAGFMAWAIMSGTE